MSDDLAGFIGDIPGWLPRSTQKAMRAEAAREYREAEDAALELHPLDPLGLYQDPVSAGWARSLTRGLRTISEVLTEALERMNAKDEAEASGPTRSPTSGHSRHARRHGGACSAARPRVTKGGAAARSTATPPR